MTSASAWAERSEGTYVVSVTDGFDYGRIHNHTPLDFGRHLAQLANADLVEIQDVGHAPPMEQPAPVTAAVRALVEASRRNAGGNTDTTPS